MKILYLFLLTLAPWCASGQQYVSLPMQQPGIQLSPNIIGAPQLFVSKYKFSKKLLEIVGTRYLDPNIIAAIDSTADVRCVIQTMTLTRDGILRDEILQCAKILQSQGAAGKTTFTSLAATAVMLAVESKDVLANHTLFTAPINDANNVSLGYMVIGIRKGYIDAGERDWELFSIHVKKHCDNPQHQTENGCSDFGFINCTGLEGVPKGTKFIFLGK